MNWVCDLVFGPVSDSETNSARSSSTTLTYDKNIIENINFEDVDENINVEPNYRLESDNTIRYVQELRNNNYSRILDNSRTNKIIVDPTCG